MFNFKPENLIGDTNKLLFSILIELRQLNESVKSLRPIAMDTVVKPKTVKTTKETKKDVNKNGKTDSRKSTVRGTSGRSKPSVDERKGSEQ